MGKKRSKKANQTLVDCESTAQPPPSQPPPSQPPPSQPLLSQLPQQEAYDPVLDALLTKKLQSLGIDSPLNLAHGSAETAGFQSMFSCEKLDVNKYMNNDDDDIMFEVEQREIFQPYACHVCKALRATDGSPLKRCNNCKMISYCSREHQKFHWLKHKELCKVVCRLCKRDGLDQLYDNALDLSPDKYRQYRMQIISECGRDLVRPIELWEREMFYYFPVCQTCHLSDKKRLTTCEKCLHVNYCQPEHLNKNHDKWCQAFCLYKDIVFYQFENGMLQPSLPNKVFSTYESLPGTMREFFLGAYGSSACMQWNKLSYSVVTDIATCPLTVLYALEQCNLQPTLASRTQLTIHMVGAELHFEADTINKWEIFLLHLLPNLKKLHLVFVGPELQERPPELVGIERVCGLCRQTGRQVQAEFHTRSFYHDYVKLSSYTQPDLICAFNAGLYRNTGYAGSDTWPPSISVMLRDSRVPVVVTAYTAQELPQDVERMKQYCTTKLELVLTPSKNPFSSTKPSLSFIDEDETPLIFKNFYIAITKCI